MDKKYLKEKAGWVRRETLRVHACAPETRIASALSCVEILTVMYYGLLVEVKAKEPGRDDRDRLIISKAHGATSFYPILADLGYIPKSELEKVCKCGALLGSIPDIMVPGFETINGSLGHGIGTACGLALAFKAKGRPDSVFVLVGDGELYEGSIWEAVMLAGGQQLDNLTLIIDNNKVSMLDFTRNIIDLEPLEDKFRSFRWQAQRTDGHDVGKLYDHLVKLKAERTGRPKVLIADTVKGKGVPELEIDPLSHVKSIKAERVRELLDE